METVVYVSRMSYWGSLKRSYCNVVNKLVQKRKNRFVDSFKDESMKRFKMF